jgi:NaMN:DMB phosphoribosyltransferase
MPHPPLCRCRFALAAAAVGLAGAVTEETSTPTSDSNYMVMQGNIGYASTGVTPPPPAPRPLRTPFVMVLFLAARQMHP